MQFVLRDRQQLPFHIIDGFMLFLALVLQICSLFCFTDMQFVRRDKQQLPFPHFRRFAISVPCSMGLFQISIASITGTRRTSIPCSIPFSIPCFRSMFHYIFHVPFCVPLRVLEMGGGFFSF